MDEIWAEFLKHERAYSTLITTTANWFWKEQEGIERACASEGERWIDECVDVWRKCCGGKAAEERLRREGCGGEAVEEALWGKGSRGKAVEERQQRKGCGGKAVEGRL